jgi:hypothetical protein
VLYTGIELPGCLQIGSALMKTFVGSEKSHTGKDLEAHCQMEELVTL